VFVRGLIFNTAFVVQENNGFIEKGAAQFTSFRVPKPNVLVVSCTNPPTANEWKFRLTSELKRSVRFRSFQLTLPTIIHTWTSEMMTNAIGPGEILNPYD
jgi:hypothetical protein